MYQLFGMSLSAIFIFTESKHYENCKNMLWNKQYVKFALFYKFVLSKKGKCPCCRLYRNFSFLNALYYSPNISPPFQFLSICHIWKNWGGGARFCPSDSILEHLENLREFSVERNSTVCGKFIHWTCSASPIQQQQHRQSTSSYFLLRGITWMTWKLGSTKLESYVHNFFI